MNDHFLSNILSTLGASSFGGFTQLFIMNQELPTENILLSSFHYGNSTTSRLNNIVRIAEVSDGIILKLPMVNAVKVPFTSIQSTSWSEKGSKVHMIIGFHDEKIGKVTLVFPTTEKAQLPRLMNLTGTPSPTPAKVHQFDHKDEDLWTIPKAKKHTPPNPQWKDNDLDKWLRIFLMLIALLILGTVISNYFS